MTTVTLSGSKLRAMLLLLQTQRDDLEASFYSPSSKRIEPDNIRREVAQIDRLVKYGTKALKDAGL